MITKEQQEALKNLTKYVSDYCQKNDISVLMVSAISEECTDGIEQVCGSVVQGNDKYLVGAIAGGLQDESKFGMLLTKGLLYASQANVKITNIPIGNADLN